MKTKFQNHFLQNRFTFAFCSFANHIYFLDFTHLSPRVLAGCGPERGEVSPVAQLQCLAVRPPTHS